MLLPGKTAIVSGVGPGLGRATALALAREGADVALAARTRSVLEDVAREVEALGRKALAVPTDITKEAEVKALADTVAARFGRIDVLVNNVGWGGHFKLLHEFTVKEWQEVLDANVVGTMTMCKEVSAHMVQAGRGAIVNVGSTVMRQGLPRRTAYGASKAAILVFTQALAAELGPKGVRANSVVPGHIWSDKIKALYESRAKRWNKTYDEIYAQYTELMALRRIPTPEEIANAIVFLASDWASAITGQSLDVNGGMFFH